MTIKSFLSLIAGLFLCSRLGISQQYLGNNVGYYLQPVTSSSGVTISASTHNKGIYAYPFVTASSAPTVVIACKLGGSGDQCDYTADSSGNLTLTFTGALTGIVEVGAGTGNPGQGPTGAGYGGTSTTSLTIGTGSQTLSTQSGLAYGGVGPVQITCTATPSLWMYGPLTSYSGTTFVFNSTLIGGSGTCAAWTLSLGALSAGQNSAFPFCYNPTGTASCTNSYNSSSAFTITAVTHGQGATAFAECLSGSVACPVTPGSLPGDLVFTFSPAATGTGYIYGGGSGAGTTPNPLPTGLTIPSPALTGTPSASSATSFTLPNAGGAAPTAGGDCRYDTTQLRTVCGGDQSTTGSLSRLVGYAHPASDVICAHGGDTSVTFNYSAACNNTTGTEATTGTEFASSVSIPANFMVKDKMLRVRGQFKVWSSATTAAPLQIRMQWGSTTIYGASGPSAITAGMTNRGILADCSIVSQAAAGTAAAQTSDCTVPIPLWLTAIWANTIAPGNVNTSSSENLSFGAYYSATGLYSATYSSGGTISGTGTCALTAFNNGLASTPTAVLNVTSGTVTSISVTATGVGATSPPTTATATGSGSGGQASCTGTVTIVGVLGGAQSNAIQLVNMEVWEDN